MSAAATEFAAEAGVASSCFVVLNGEMNRGLADAAEFCCAADAAAAAAPVLIV